ncbi:MAG: S41 family peptidase [Acidobacteriota bacterium]
MSMVGIVDRRRHCCRAGFVLVVVGACTAASLVNSQEARAEGLSKIERERSRVMLKVIKDDIKKHYYDRAFHGVKLEARFAEADSRLHEATSIAHAFGIIGQALLDFDDSHTFFIPPPRTNRVDYGWQVQMIGEKCNVIAVKPGSDAEAKGLRVGDIVHSINGFTPARDTLWKMKYSYYMIRPLPGMRIVAESPGGPAREIDVMAEVRQGKRVLDLTGTDEGVDISSVIRDVESEDRLHRQRHWEAGADLIIWKMPEFDDDESSVDRMMDKVRAHKALVLDLRGNTGGSAKTLERLAGYFFDKDLKIADLKGAKPMKPLLAKSRGRDAYAGKLVVVVDSQTASASEIFARLVQIEKRGTVLGDRTAGAVMQAVYHGHHLGVDKIVLYGASITDADAIMSDGKSLEKVGVVPDELLLPSAQDLAGRRDPALARAAELAGTNIDAVKAGTLFPLEWQD